MVLVLLPQAMMRSWNNILWTCGGKGKCFSTCNCCGQLMWHVQCWWVEERCKSINEPKCGNLKCVHYYVNNTKVVQNVNEFYIGGVQQVSGVNGADHC